MRLKSSVVLIVGFTVYASIASVVVAQPERDPNRGFVAGGSYALSNIETINTVNGNLMMNIPLASLPSGPGPGFTFAIRYDSKLWNNKGTNATDMVSPETGEPVYFSLESIEKSDNGGWKDPSFSTYRLEVTSRFDLQPIPDCGISSPEYEKSFYMWKLKMLFPDGSSHEFRPVGQTDIFGDGYFKVDPNGNTYSGDNKGCTSIVSTNTTGMTYVSTDGSFLRLVVDYQSGNNGKQSVGNTWTLYYPDGSKARKNSSTDLKLYDRNGNYISFLNSNGNYVEDQFGRGIRLEVDGSDSSKHYVKQKGVDGEWLVTTIKWKTIWVRRTFDSAPGEVYCYPWRHEATLHQGLDVIDYIELPEQSGSLRYTFGYNGVDSEPEEDTSGVGELNHVVMPSGAEADYEYQRDGTGFLGAPADLIANSPTEKTLTYDLEYDGSSTPTTEIWTYDMSPGSAYITAPDGSETTESSGAVYQNNTVFTGKVFHRIAADGTKTERIYNNNKTESVSYTSEINAYVQTEFTSIKDANGTYTLTAAKDFSYDKNGNLTSVREYDWMPYSSVPRDSGGLPSALPSGASSYLKRQTVNTYYNDTPDSSSTNYSDEDSYHLSSNKRVLNLLKSTEIQDSSSTRKSHSDLDYDYENYDSSNTKAGNLTETKTWDSFKGGSAQSYSNPLTSTNSITTSATYNSYGMPITTTDANNITTQITYGNVTVGGQSVTGPYPTQTVAAHGTGLARTSTAVYDFYTGVVTSATDEDNDVTTVTVYDDFGRPTTVKSAYGTDLEAHTVTEYHDEDRYVVVKSDLETEGDGKKVAIQHYDQLGRVRLSRTLEDPATQEDEDPCLTTSTPCAGVKVQTRYKIASGYTYQLTSNPYRAAVSTSETDPTMGWTLATAWSSGIRSEVQTFGGAGLPTAFGGSNTNSTGIVRTDIDATATKVTDQAGKVRRSVSNALGWLLRVDEPNSSDQLDVSGNPYQPTSYTYDVLNNLLTVTQASSTTTQCGGAESCSQTRTFTYSSISRLRTAANPESGTITYTYDANGNLTKKKDARNVETNYTYDVLNRVTERSYATPNPTPSPSWAYQHSPTVTYTYGTTAPKVGKLTKVESSVSTTEYTSFDILGRVTGHKQTTDGGAAGGYATEYKYNLAGALIEETYPSGRIVKNELDDSGDLAVVKSKKNSTSGPYHDYAFNFVYNAAGAVTSMQLGNNRYESTLFNSRLQPSEIRLGTGPSSAAAYDMLRLEYSYGTTANNGNLLSQTTTVPTVGSSTGFSAVQTYNYDSLNRLKDATEMLTPIGGSATQTWKQTYTFDRYGNRRFDFTSGNTTFPASSCTEAICNPTISTSTNRITSSGWTYDAAGNTLTDANGQSYVYDGENKQVKASNGGGTLGEYFYDGDGKRVKKVVASTGEVTIFVYDAAGKQIAEYSTIVESVEDAKVAYLTADHLGSPRINTDRDGKVTARHDYHPYGEEITAARTSHDEYTPDSVRKQFTGYERDGESGLDFAQARHNSSSLGRFVSPDSFDAVSIDLTLFQFNRFLAQPQNWNKYSYCVNNPLRYVDTDGRHPVAALLLALAGRAAAGAAIGAVVGGGIELMAQMIQGGRDINWDRVRNAAIAGAVAGAVTGGAGAIPLAAFRSLAGQLAVAGAANGVEGTVQRGLNGEENDIGRIFTDMLTGVLAFGATKRANDLMESSSKLASQNGVSRISNNYRVDDPPIFGSYIRQNRASQYRNYRFYRETGAGFIKNGNSELIEQLFPHVYPWNPPKPKSGPDAKLTKICDEHGKNCEDVMDG